MGRGWLVLGWVLALSVTPTRGVTLGPEWA